MEQIWLRHRDTCIILISFVGALAVGAILFLLHGVNPLSAYGAMLRGAFGSPESFLSTLAKAIPIVLAALSISAAFTAGIWNIGAEGQLYMAAFAAAMAGIFLPLGSLGHFPALAIVLCCGIAAGALWAWLPARMSLDLGMNVVVVTIMGNAIAQYFTSYMATGPVAGHRVAAGMTDRISEVARFARFSGLSVLNEGALLALAAVVGTTFLLLFTVWGYECRMIRQNPRFAAAGGVDVRSRQLGAMLLSGSLAGLAGTLLVMGDNYRFLVGISPGYTWTGMILAMMVGYNPIGAVAAGIVYAAMSAGALEMELLTGVPTEVVEVIMTTAVLFVTAGLTLANRLANRIRED